MHVYAHRQHYSECYPKTNALFRLACNCKLSSVFDRNTFLHFSTNIHEDCSVESPMHIIYEPWHDKTNKVSAPSEDSDQPGHPPSLIRVFAVGMKKAWVLIYPLSAQRRLWSDWADAQADLSLRWAHTHFVGIVMSWLICIKNFYAVYPQHTCMFLWRNMESCP